MKKVLVSACLMGQKVRYDGNALTQESELFQRLVELADIVTLCPEVAGGLPTPRPPAEIDVADGGAVIAGKGKVISVQQIDVTGHFVSGAQKTLELCKQHNIKIAILTESSPSCGSTLIYNGQFAGTKVSGHGVTTALLRQHGITVFSQFNVEGALAALKL
ncbi:DUF523 domain-containing protein [Grimontia sp. NTOU-MAR1]|uniref:DUF523 domain-containing protein n=1 Tax=Grimontia sp. NTOU-MAR1 TaxID=3111011 RepID=UPI002DBFC839|nr:DUF523 domain-containing protein [Grimontia sp. NTOU-MAR1]WRW00334.1 DUF523 domain-containing protein [Grimontia sp. NTOU-MAR1]